MDAPERDSHHNPENKAEQIKLSFEPLSADTLQEALALAKTIFPYDYEKLEEAYYSSINPDDAGWQKRRMLKYFAVKDEETGRIIAITGLYNWKVHAEDEVWLGWFGVSPNMRGQGIGKRVLEWTMQKAREKGYKKFRLWTTDDKGEQDAQKLYDDMGMSIYKQEKNTEKEYTTLYREINL
ncbi:GNAT family N-acetyltransferase [Candidatus Parcubacteria bacterium]|nr:GNAT family N-acetyltransferase [Candidatus Parcubacteria bacterium]